jgi:hypothetical protein
MASHLDRAVGKDGLLVVISLPQADALAPPQVDRRPDFHALAAPARRSGRNGKTSNMTQIAATCKREEIEDDLFTLLQIGHIAPP